MPTVDRLPYTPWRDRGGVVDGAFRWRLGARSLDLADWIELGDDADGPDGWIAQKRRVLDEHHDTACAVLDGIESEANEVADALVAHLRGRWPERFGDVVLDVDRHPLEAASLLVPEDLVLMVERDGRLVCGGGSVCFPNRWDLQAKLGRSMSEVHAPVAHLNAQLESAVDGFLERLRPERPMWRAGWGVIDVADGYTPIDGTGPVRPDVASAADLFVRVERETLRRFPSTRCVLFTIRTYVAPLSVVLGDTESAADMASLIAAMPDGVRSYKGLAAHADVLSDAFDVGEGLWINPDTI